MAKFCGNCGAQVDDNAKVCGNCGVPIGSAPETKARPKAVGLQKRQKKGAGGPKAKKFMIVGIIAVAAILIIILIISLFRGRSYKGMVEDFWSGIAKGNGELAQGCISEAAFTDDFERTDFGDLVTDVITKGLEGRFGEELEITCVLRNEDKIEGDDLLDLRYDLEDAVKSRNKTFDTEQITAAMEVDMRVTYTGGRKRESTSTTYKNIILVYEAGAWRILDPMGSLGFNNTLLNY